MPQLTRLLKLGLHISVIDYFEKEAPFFIDITDTNLTIDVVENNPDKVITDSEEEVVKKKNKYTIKKEA